MNEGKLVSKKQTGARRSWLVAFLVFAVAVFLLLGYYQYISIPRYIPGEARGKIAELSMQKFPPGVKAPVFSLENVDGKTVSLRQFKGSYLLLSFRTTW
ncbi:MAG: hypothetical protein V3S39_08100 [Thermodesulfobacteriota bacterium]